MITSLALTGGALVLLAFAADQFVIGAARIALIRRIPALLVGIVIIGFGTSLPELLVSTLATAQGEPEIALANITGSNVANLSLLLGIGALIRPITVNSRTVRRETPLTIAAMAAFAIAAHQGVTRWEGVALVVALGPCLWIMTRSAAAPTPDVLGVEAEEFADPAGHAFVPELGRTVLGLVGTVAASQLLLRGAIDIAERADLPDSLVGATIVAVGTSLPELVTVVQSARRGETDLIVGNVLGSNLFNSLAVGGAVGLTSTGAPTATIAATNAAVIVAALTGVAMHTKNQLDRWEGAALVFLYGATLRLAA